MPEVEAKKDTFTLDEVRATFFAMFYKSGEHWFTTFDDEASAFQTEQAWDEFVRSLRGEPVTFTRD